jgi:HTH-like domain
VSPARRRACVAHVVARLGVSERTACRVLGQHRATRRKLPAEPDDEERLTTEIVGLARRYGRYGYRRIAALLRQAGWRANRKRVERIWRREGLKLPARQPRRDRLWLADGSCVRLRPERPDQVWAYDLVEDRTRDGRKFRMLCVIDEFTREALAIRVARKLAPADVVDTPADLFVARGGVPGHSRSRPGLRVHRHGRAGLDRGRRRRDRVHREEQPVGERVRGGLQRQARGRAADRRDLQPAAGGADPDRGLAPALQRRAAPLRARPPPAGARGPARPGSLTAHPAVLPRLPAVAPTQRPN